MAPLKTPPADLSLKSFARQFIVAVEPRFDDPRLSVWSADLFRSNLGLRANPLVWVTAGGVRQAYWHWHWFRRRADVLATATTFLDAVRLAYAIAGREDVGHRSRARVGTELSAVPQ